MTQRLGIDPDTINAAAFASAFNKCAEEVTLTLPTDYADYQAMDTRYNADGVIFSQTIIPRRLRISLTSPGRVASFFTRESTSSGLVRTQRQ